MNINLTGFIAGLAVFVLTLELVRRKHLREKYAVLWLVVGAGSVVIAAFPQLLQAVAHALGFRLPANLLFAAAALILLVVSMQLSFELGRLEAEGQRMAEEIALLREELAERKRSAEE